MEGEGLRFVMLGIALNSFSETWDHDRALSIALREKTLMGIMNRGMFAGLHSSNSRTIGAITY